MVTLTKNSTSTQAPELNEPNLSIDPNEPDEENGFPYFSVGLFILSLALTGLFYWLGQGRGADSELPVTASQRWIEFGFILSAATAISMVIWQACDPFADAAQWVGKTMKLPSSVRGATLDAIASSMPELFTGIFFVMVALSGDPANKNALMAEGYGSTIATCAGSSIYNLILIPAVCAITISFSRHSRPHVEVSRDVIKREGTWLMITQIGLLIFLFQTTLYWWMAVVMLAAYAGYVLNLYVATRRFRKDLADGTIDDDDELIESSSVLFGWFDIKLNAVNATLILVLSTLAAALACYVLVNLTNSSAAILGVPPFFVAVILTAAVSSIPDSFVSLGSAKRGDDSGAIANVFGSNIFDICIGMSIPLLALCMMNGWGSGVSLLGANGETLRGVIGLRIFLFVLTVVAMYVMWSKRKITRQTGWFFCFLYAIFVLYAILGAFDVIPV